MTDKGFESWEFDRDSLKLLKATYRLANDLPDCERYNLSDQMRPIVKEYFVTELI